ncbi:MAG: hypothetical protein IJH63_10280 [Methanobrevibacter sp.]|nr:hypothetical protein [Methanosphaera sp.]MBR0371086.1 hypothetical protein [Methanobrevibacter sp.]
MKGIPGTTNISYHKHDDRYSVSKFIDGKVKSMGGFKTLIGALMIRDWCQANNWQPYPKKRSADWKYIQYREDLDVYEIIKNINGKNEYFGRYHNFEEAKKWRDYFQSNGWNVNERLVGSINKNIKFHNGKYRIYKNIDYKEYYFGSFDSLEEATNRLFMLRREGWRNVLNDNTRLQETTTKNIIKLPNGKYEIVKTINGIKETYGVFDDYETAVAEVKLLRKCNWDYDALCEGIDETSDGLKFLEIKRPVTFFEKYNKGRNDAYAYNRRLKKDYDAKIKKIMG